MKKMIVSENQKGLLFRNGKYLRSVGAGKYYLFGGKEMELTDIEMPLCSEKCRLEQLLCDEELKNQLVTVTVGDEEYAIHYVDGQFKEILESGRYAFWKEAGEHSFQIADISTPEVSSDIPTYIFKKCPSCYYQKAEIADYEKALLFFDGKPQRALESGIYYFWNTGTKIEVRCVDMRGVQMQIAGQEILTQDKVTLRINFVCKYRVSDHIRILTEIRDYEEQLYTAAQLALREYIGKCKLDEILENKEKIAETVFEKLKAYGEKIYLSVTEAGVKDIILPGDVREIMNTVLIAEKRAQANVIARREEVASTRSLLNTAKLMEENQTLFKLKEMEYMERICENVGNITLNGNGNMISRLSELFCVGTAGKGETL